MRLLQALLDEEEQPAKPAAKPKGGGKPPRKRVRAMTVTEQIDRIVLGIKYAYDLSVADETAARRRVLMAVTRILASCNRDDLPEALEIVAAQMQRQCCGRWDAYPAPAGLQRNAGRHVHQLSGSIILCQATRDYLQDYEDILWRYRKPGVPRREEP